MVKDILLLLYYFLYSTTLKAIIKFYPLNIKSWFIGVIMFSLILINDIFIISYLNYIWTW